MFPIFINDGTTELPKDDIFYVICKEGVYLKKKMGVMESMVPVNNISILESIEATAQMHIPMVPGQMFAKIISFFKAVYKEHRAEAIVLIFYNEDTQKYKIFPPYQKVNYGAVDYNRGISLDGWQMIGDVHSHASMSAFHSGTDDDDEKSFDGLHITIGDNDDDEVSISASIVSNGTRFLIDPLDYIEDLAITVDIDKTEETPTTKYYKWVGGKMIEAKTSTVRTYRKLDKRYVSTVIDKQKKFNAKWMKMVEYNRPTYYGYGGRAGAWAGWGGNFDPTAWAANRNKTKPQIVPKGAIIPPQNVGPQKTPGIVFPPHDDNESNPCKDCVFVNHKIDWVMEQLLEEVDGETGESTTTVPMGMESYVCDQCQSELTIPESQDAICPICKTDKYMVDMTPFPDDEEDGIEYEVADEKEEDIPFKCPNCEKKFYLVTQENCPHCGFNILQSEEEDQSLSDMGAQVEDKVSCVNCQVSLRLEDLTHGTDCPFCRAVLNPDSDLLDPNLQAIEAAQQADKATEAKLLPIPGKDSVPINKETVPHQPYKKGPFAFMRGLTRKRKRGKGKK